MDKGLSGRFGLRLWHRSCFGILCSGIEINVTGAGFGGGFLFFGASYGVV